MTNHHASPRNPDTPPTSAAAPAAAEEIGQLLDLSGADPEVSTDAPAPEGAR